jgi:hypothetical protein
MSHARREVTTLVRLYDGGFMPYRSRWFSARTRA